MDELLAKYMMGEASPEEMELVAKWLEESEYNEKYFAHFKLIWETAESLKTKSNLDVEQSWEEFKQLTQQAEKGPAQNRYPMAASGTSKGSLVHWIRIAAIWVCVVGISALLYTFLRPGAPELLTLETFDEVKTDTLSDGSVLTLNKNSVLTYPATFTGNTRELRLISGEAFFSIAKDPSKPFLVQLDHAVVKVVGTSFNIRKGKKKAEVIVETGIVEVIRKKVVVRLQPAEKVEIDYTTGELKKGLSKDNFYNYYRTKEFVANKTPLWRVAEVLNEVYKVNIQIPDRTLANRTLTTTLKLGPLDPILDLLASTFNVHIIHQSGQIIIK
ncbi:FecR family protein [Pedobacter sp. AW31-3R]|uniref:FecR family protein n=1 Tax=Pedobacter sp. AW31-3R TaxID=3445781 RepID=UPI003FA0CA61